MQEKSSLKNLHCWPLLSQRYCWNKKKVFFYSLWKAYTNYVCHNQLPGAFPRLKWVPSCLSLVLLVSQTLPLATSNRGYGWGLFERGLISSTLFLVLLKPKLSYLQQTKVFSCFFFFSAQLRSLSERTENAKFLHRYSCTGTGSSWSCESLANL